MNAVEGFRQAATSHKGKILFTSYPQFGQPRTSVVRPWELEFYLHQPEICASPAEFIDGNELRWVRKPGGSFTDGGSNNSLWLEPR